MIFDFSCNCGEITHVKSRIGKIPRTPRHCDRKMKRLFSTPNFHVTWGIADYANKAYDGTEQIPGMTTQEVRRTVDMNPKPTI